MAERVDGWNAALAGRYHLDRLLGEGSAACVYAARDLRHERDVAVKILRAELVQEVVSPRFLREIHIAAQLSHPHILPLFDSGEVDGIPYFVMPLVEGRTLRERMDREGALPVDVALGITRQVAAALEYAHGHGVVHRDIKPENILLVGREALVADFGIAVAFDAGASSERITAAGVVVGTPRYMSPEQAAGDRSVDARSDIYALGCVMYEMLTGQPPFAGGDRRSVAVSHALTAPPSPRAARREVSVAVDRAVRAAMAKNPADRIQTARALIDALSTPLPRHAVPSRLGPFRRWLLAASVVLVAIVAVAALRWFSSWPSTMAPARRWVLVADFAGDPSEREMTAAVRDLAIAELSQSSIFSIVPGDQVQTARRNAGLPDSTRIDAVRARELATRSSVRVVVEGTVRRLGADRWSITVRAVSAEDGAVLLSAAAAASDRGDTLVRSIGQLMRELRRKLGERPADLAATRPLENVATPSLAAYRLYHDALAQLRSADYDGAVHVLHRAVALDSGFASAWAMMANAFVTMHRPDSASWAFARAGAIPNRLSDADRDRLAGDIAFNVERDYPAAVQAYDRFLAQRPASLGGLNNRAIFLSALGRHEEALAAFERTMTVDPLLVGPRKIELLNVASELVVLGRRDSARVVARALTGAHAQYMQMLLFNADAQWAQLRKAARAVLDDPGASRFAQFPAVLHEVGALEALGDTAQAATRLGAAMASATGTDQRWLAHARLLRDAARGERPNWPLPASIASDGSPANALLQGLYAVQRGDTVDARRVLRVLDRLSPRAAREIGYGPVYLAAWLDLSAGRPVDALTRLAEPTRLGEHDPFSVDRVSGLALRLLEARALAAAGRTEDAARSAAALGAPVGMPPSHYPLRGLVAAFAGRKPAAGSR